MLYISNTGVGGVTLNEGQNEFPFYYQLNENLPSSYIGKYGSVTYLIKAQLRPDRRHGADAMITNEPFLVLRRYDLSLEPFKLQVGNNSFTTKIDDRRVRLSYDFGLPLHHHVELLKLPLAFITQVGTGNFNILVRQDDSSAAYMLSMIYTSCQAACF